MERPMEMGESYDPVPSQPRMFGGHVGLGSLPWAWATEHLSRAQHYWIVTTRRLVSRTAARSGGSGWIRPFTSAPVPWQRRT